MRSFKLQSCLTVKGVYTSDISYACTTLPKEMALKLPKDKDWCSEYSWVDLPKKEIAGGIAVKEAKAAKA